MRSIDVKKKLGISDHKLKKLRDEGIITYTYYPEKKHKYIHDKISVDRLYMRLYNSYAKERRIAADPDYYKKKLAERPKKVNLKIGSIGKEVIGVIANEKQKLLVHKKKNTPVVRKPKNKEMFTQKKFLSVYEEYNFLRNFGIVRKYIQKKHVISINILESILYLYALEYFTSTDYMRFPHSFSHRTVYMKGGVLNELVEVAVPATNKAKNIFTLSRKFKKIVVEFYKLLAGVQKIPIDGNLKKITNQKYLNCITRMNEGSSSNIISDACLYLASQVKDA